MLSCFREPIQRIELLQKLLGIAEDILLRCLIIACTKKPKKMFYVFQRADFVVDVLLHFIPTGVEGRVRQGDVH